MNDANHETVSLPDFISRRIHDLRSRKTLSQIAREAGFTSRSALHAIAAGSTRLPLDHTVRLAQALECDVYELALISLRQFVPDDLVKSIIDRTGDHDGWENVLATSVALAAEIAGLKDDLKAAVDLMVDAQEGVSVVGLKLDRLGKECSELATRARSQLEVS